MYLCCLPTYILSIIGSLFIIFNFISFVELRTFSFKLVLFIAISDLFRAIAMILPSYYNEDLNKCLYCIQSILGNICGLSTVLWNASIAHALKYVFQSRVKSITKEDTNLLFHRYLCINITLAIVLSIPPIFPFNQNRAYSIAGAWCWIKDDDQHDSIMRIVCQYAVQWICGIYIIYVYWHFVRKLFHSTSSVAISRANLMMHTIGRLKWYPLVLLLLYLP